MQALRISIFINFEMLNICQQAIKVWGNISDYWAKLYSGQIQTGYSQLAIMYVVVLETGGKSYPKLLLKRNIWPGVVALAFTLSMSEMSRRITLIHGQSNYQQDPVSQNQKKNQEEKEEKKDFWKKFQNKSWISELKLEAAI